MSVFSMIYSFVFMPLQLLFEITYSYAYRFVGENYGLAIIALSMAINILVLPLYNRADAIQEEERQKEEALDKGVSHIKKTFRGDEKTMMLQTYYRQNNYSPLHSLRSATSLLLEIPFFIAAYQFLSNLDVLKGTPFGPISNLGAPDSLITVGSISINILPFIMTALNLISAVIFTKNSSKKTKIQLYSMALFFLAFLYNSPAGLVFYWTLNNLFSLVKTVFYKLKNPKKILRGTMSLVGICFIFIGVFFFVKNHSIKMLLLLFLLGIFLCVPLLFNLLNKKYNLLSSITFPQPNKKVFFSGSLFLALLTGLLIPSAVISASPQEFIIIGVNFHPIWYIVSSSMIAIGTFVLWIGVFYRLFPDNTKIVFERIIVITCAIAIVNYLFFGKNLGIMSSELVYDISPVFTIKQKLINIIVLLCISIIIYILTKLKADAVRFILIISSTAICLMSCINLVGIHKSVSQIDIKQSSQIDKSSIISLSKTNKNVIVFMLDRAMGEYIPFIFDEYPELKEQFAGFTYYSNVISFGGYTNFGTPALFGGYEYTPIEMSKRDTEPLVKKHNEALKVMPVLFDTNGFDVTVCDPTYANYREIPDLSIYKDYPKIKTFITQTMYVDYNVKLKAVSDRQQNFFSHSIFKIVPVCLKSTLYESGTYHHKSNAASTKDAYAVLKNLIEMTSVSNHDNGQFIMIINDTTHSFGVFSELSYLNTSDEKNKSLVGTSRAINGNTLLFNEDYQINAYQNNVGALKRIGEWLDYLKLTNTYDNTRIILVADHGRGMMQIEKLLFDETATNKDNEIRYGDLEFYYPLLMVKDFDSHEFVTSDEFMTNADVPTIATKDIINDPINPFTDKKINNDEKYAHPQYIIASSDWSVSKNNGNTFLPARWYSVHDSIWDLNNWELVAEDAILP